MLIKLDQQEVEALLECIDVWLTDAPNIEDAYYGDSVFEGPESFLEVIEEHHRTKETIETLKERLSESNR